MLSTATPFAVPIAALVAAMPSPVLPETPRRAAQRFDLPGALTLGIGITAVLFAVNRGRGDRGKDGGLDKPRKQPSNLERLDGKTGSRCHQAIRLAPRSPRQSRRYQAIQAVSG